MVFKVRKVAKIRNPHLTQDTTWESDKNTIKHHKGEPRGQPFPTNDPQKKYRLRTVCKNMVLEGLNWFNSANLTLSADVDQEQIDVWFAWKTPNLSMHHLLEYINQDIKRRYIFFFVKKT